jgi:N-acyl-D-amino-acid deacylase
VHDIIIRGGRIVDGTGGAVLHGDVAIKSGVITEVGAVEGRAHRTIIADGALVTPGFIDIHTHYDGQFLWDDQLDPSFSNGVTTAIGGNCGVGFAPARAEHRQMLIELMEGVEDIPGAVLNEGLDWRWNSFSDYLDRLDARRFGMDVGVQMTHSPLRVYVMGERAARHEVATQSDLQQMTQLVTAGMHAGALGFSAASFRGHRSSKGDFVPGTFSNDQEMLSLAAAMGATGKGVFQIVPHGAAGDAMGPAATRQERLAEHDRFIGFARAANRPLTYSLLQFNSDPQDWRAMLEASERANAAGMQIYPQTLARSAGAITTLEGYHPFMLRPSYLQVSHLPLQQRLNELRSAQRRAAILSEASSETEALSNKGTALVVASMIGFLPNMYLMSKPLDYEPGVDRTVQQCALKQGKTLEEVLYDHLVAAEGDQFACTFATNYENSSLQTVYRLLEKPFVMSSLSDAGAHVKYVSDGAIATFQLAFWCRDRSRGPRLPLEFMVRKATLDCANLYGLVDRGVIAPGKRADMNIIDYDRLNAEMPHMSFDLPSGGGRLLQNSSGYLATLVAGIPTRENDEDTGARPGRLIRSWKSRRVG